MTEFNELPLSKNQMRKKRDGKVSKETDAHPEYTGTEAALQMQMDDLLDALGIWFIRIPDSIWRFIAYNASPQVRKWFGHVFGGVPDNLPMIKVSDKYMLCCPVELKRKAGKLHGKQKHWEGRGIPVQVSRSPEQNISIIEQFQRDADIIMGIFTCQKTK